MKDQRNAAETVVEAWFAEHRFPGYLDPIRRKARDFEEAHPGYRVRIRGYDFHELPRTLATAVERGRTPHLVEYYYASSRLARDQLGADGRPLFTSLERAIAGREEVLGEKVVTDDLVPAVREYYTFDGDLASMPITATTTVLYSNMDLLQEAGVSEAPRTWEDLARACERISRSRGGRGHPATWANHGWLFQQAVASQGGLLSDRENGRRGGHPLTVDLASEEMLAFVGWWKRMDDAGHYLYTGMQEDWEGTFRAFASQRVAFVMHTSKLADAAVHAGRAGGFDVGVSILPRNGDAAYAGNLPAGQSLWLSGDCEKAVRDGALAFTQFLASTPNAVEWHRESTFVPITRDAFRNLDGKGWFREDGRRRVASDQLEASDLSPAALGAVIGDLPEIQRLLTSAMESVLVRGEPAEDALRHATDRAQELVDEYNSWCLGSPPRSPRRLDVV
ncbi:extracellular solute-binding protein [Nocardiopsis sp. RV163]|uniref:extracellular solute-binding protein n=1 Tax=Nocardiopsis sp. RV163 TaxID=1661388 RepID=UPI00064C077E|nr:extracellular solute-binding protein [Nocardiopsis sp. RV163]